MENTDDSYCWEDRRGVTGHELPSHTMNRHDKQWTGVTHNHLQICKLATKRHLRLRRVIGGRVISVELKDIVGAS